MSGSLYLKYNATDDGSRTPTNPVPPNTDFWDGNAVRLATTGNIYTIGQNAPIEVQVSLKPEAPAYEIINVEVWVCDPSTVAGPSTALAPYQGAANGTALTGFCIPSDGPVPVIQVPTAPDTTYFKPYPGISNLPGGHCCLIANCWGTTSDGMSDGVSLASSAASLPNLVQTDQHVAQRNIFASTSQNMMIIFPFRAATPLGEGAERVRLEIVETSPAELRTILAGPRRRAAGRAVHGPAAGSLAGCRRSPPACRVGCPGAGAAGGLAGVASGCGAGAPRRGPSSIWN